MDCGHPWPCDTRRAQLLAEFPGSARITLFLMMGSLFIEAVQDLPAEPCGDMYYRFLGWLRWLTESSAGLN